MTQRVPPSPQLPAPIEAETATWPWLRAALRTLLDSSADQQTNTRSQISCRAGLDFQARQMQDF